MERSADRQMITIPKTMRGVWLTGHGGPDRLEFRNDIPVPAPGPGEVLVRVAAAGVNHTDINTRTAWYSRQGASEADAAWTGQPISFPLIQGIDVCGTIAAVGPGVAPGRIGERVLIEPCLREANGQALDPPWFLGSECHGGFAEFTAAASRHAHTVDSRLSDIELASFPCSCSTAENCLTRAAVKKGDRVLVTGASGGVGSAAVQLAKDRQAHVTAVTSPSKAGAVRDIGADQVVFRDHDPMTVLGRNSLDVVIDLVAGRRWPQFLELLRPGGRYAVAGAVAGPMVELDVRTLYLKDLTLIGCTAPEPAVFRRLIRKIEENRIVPLVAAVFDLTEIRDAQKMFMDKQFVGKIVLTVT